MHNYPDSYSVRCIDHRLDHSARVPGSKSITNRGLILAALAGKNCIISGALESEDTTVMVDSLRKLGFILTWQGSTIHFHANTAARIPAIAAELFVANSGTSMRFLAAMVATGHGRYRLDGVPRMRERPIQDLLDALTTLGVRAFSDLGNGCPPICIEAAGMPGGRTTLNANVSSQFLSAILMAALWAETDVEITTSDTVVSEPYIAMTVAMIRAWGGRVEVEGPRYRVRSSQTGTGIGEYAVEPDASAASYFYAAAAIRGGSIRVQGMTREMLQGDVKFVDVLSLMGCTIDETPDGLRVSFDTPTQNLSGIDIDMNAISDTVMTLAAVACFASSPTTIRNVAHIRHKETDRIAAMATELRKLGIDIQEFEDGLTITPGPMTGCVLDTYDDHRMAMSLALIGLRVPGVVIRNPGCVAKTYPKFWDDFAKL